MLIDHLVEYLNGSRGEGKDWGAVRSVAGYYAWGEGHWLDGDFVEIIQAFGRVERLATSGLRKMRPAFGRGAVGSDKMQMVKLEERWQQEPATLYQSSRNRPLSEAEMAAVALFLWLVMEYGEFLRARGKWKPRLKRCSECGKFFADKSSNLVGRTCSDRCRQIRHRSK